MGWPKVWCGRGAVVSVRGRRGGGTNGGCAWWGEGQSRPGRVVNGRGGGVLSVVAGACPGWPSSRLPWTASDQPSGC